jgi:S1-C subfamily serine protease
MSDFQNANAGMALSNAVADAVERAGKVTVMVQARRRLPSSGVVFQPGLVLTADHTIEREEDIQVGLPDGRSVTATLAGRDRGTDLAVLRLSDAGSLAAVQAPAQDAGQPGGPRVGHLVVAAGRPSEEGIQASLGMITAIGGGLRTGHGALLERYLVTDTVPLPGASGGPLLNLAGEVIGINSSGLARGASLAIPARLAFEIGAGLAQHGHIRRGYLGIRSQPVELPAQGREGAPAGQASGLLIVGIEADGPAAGGGLMVGDILIGLHGKPVANHDDLLAALAGEVVGQTADVLLLRGGQMQTVKVRVGEKK